MFRLLACVTTEHDWAVVILAGGICLISSISAFALMDQARKTDRNSFRWNLAAAFTAGTGLWSTHFTAMLGYNAPVDLSFDPGWTAASLVSILIVSWISVTILSSTTSTLAALFSGLLFGGGIFVMHYSGMAGLVIPGRLMLDTSAILQSLLVGGAVCAASFAVFRLRVKRGGKLLAAALLALATCLLHFIGMAGLTIKPDLTVPHAGVAIQKLELILAMVGLALTACAVSLTSIVAAEKVAEARADLAEADSRAKSSLLATVSHELRTPLNGMIGILEILKQRSENAPDGELLDTALACGQSLSELIDTILDMAHLDHKGEAVLKTSGLPGLVRGVATMLEHLARQRGLTIAIDAPEILVRAPAARIRQVLINLIGNAVKFSEHGRIDVRIARVGELDGVARYRFEVTDCGIGVPADAQARIFDPFSQADASIGDRFGGSGMGLAISKQIIEDLGGTIGVLSDGAKGSTFWFELPLKEEPAVTPPQVDTSLFEPGNAGLCVLVVEDNRVNRMVATTLLGKLGIAVDVAENGQIALERIAEKTYDLVLMDLQMPVMDGLTATRAIRASAHLGRQPVIVAFSANSSDEDRLAAVQAGMDDFLTKPINLSRLREVMERWHLGRSFQVDSNAA